MKWPRCLQTLKLTDRCRKNVEGRGEKSFVEVVLSNITMLTKLHFMCCVFWALSFLDLFNVPLDFNTNNVFHYIKNTIEISLS